MELLQVMKKPIPLNFRIAKEVEVVETLEGKVTAQIGDAILTGTKGECWPIPASKFETTYDFSKETGICSKKPMIVQAERMTEAFEVKVSWTNEPLKGEPGGYRLIYGDNDFGVVDATIFAETYEILNDEPKARPRPS